MADPLESYARHLPHGTAGRRSAVARASSAAAVHPLADPGDLGRRRPAYGRARLACCTPLSHHLGGRDPMIESLLICFTAGLLWVIALALILVRRELGGLQPARVRDAPLAARATRSQDRAARREGLAVRDPLRPVLGTRQHA